MAELNADFEQQLRSANEQLYKHSRDLAIRNKTLSLLRQLYQISIQSLDSATLAEQIVKTVRTALEFEMVGVMLYDRTDDSLTPLCFDKSDRVATVSAEAGLPLSTTALQHVGTIPFLSPVLEGKSTHTKSLLDVWQGAVPAETLDVIATSGHIRELSIHPLRIDGKLQGVLILALNRPIAEMSQFERESIDSLVDVVAIALDRAHLYEEVKLANEQQVTLIHFITHQIKGFVAKSRNIFSMALEGDFGPIGDQLKPMLEEGFKSDTKGAATIQEILNAANIKSGKVTFTMAPFDLKALIEEIAGEQKSATDAKRLSLKVELGTEPTMVTGDRTQLVNVFKNLIDNSVKYTPKGEVDISLKKEVGKVIFEIKDTGVGITPEDMKNLFTEGGHGKESSKVNVESTGFGLYIVKSIVEAHKGRVWAESEGAGHGSRFFVELPA